MAAAATVSASPPVSAENHQQPLIQQQIQQQQQQRHESQQLQLQMLQLRQERHYLLQQQHHHQARDQREPHHPHQPLLLQQQQAQHGLTGVLLHQYQLLLSQKQQHDAQQQQLHALQASGVNPESEEGDVLEAQRSSSAGISTREMIPQHHQLQQILEQQQQQQLQGHIEDEDEEHDPDHSASSVIVILPDNSLRLFHQPLLLACDVLAEFPNHFLIHAPSSLDSATCLTEEEPSHYPSLPSSFSAATASDLIGRSAASTWLQRVHPEDVLSCGATYALVELPPTVPGGASTLTSATSSSASSPQSARAADPRLERSHSETRTKVPPSGSGPLVPRRCTSSSNADLERGFEFPSSAPHIPSSPSSFVPHVSSSSVPHLSSSLPRDGFPFYAHPSWASESERAAASSIFSIEPESTSMAGGSTRKPPRPRPDGSRSPLGLHLGFAGGGGGGHRRRFSAHEVSPEWIGGGLGGNGGVASSPHEGSLHGGAMQIGGSARWSSGDGGGVSGGAAGGGGGSGPQQPDFSRLLRPLQEPDHLDAQQQHQNMGQKQAPQQRRLLQQPRPGSPANLDAPSGIDSQSAAKSSGRVFSKMVSSVNLIFSRSGNSAASSSSASPRLSPSAAPSSSSSSSSLKSAASFLGNRLSRKSSKSSSSLQKHQMFVTMSDPCLAASATLHMPMPMPTELSVELLAPRPSASSNRPPSSLRPGAGGSAPNHQPW